MVRNRAIILFRRLVSLGDEVKKREIMPSSDNLIFAIDNNWVSNSRPRLVKSFRGWIPGMQWRRDSKYCHLQ